MREITLTVYKYQELSKKGQHAAQEWYQRSMAENGDYTQHIADMFRNDLAQLGLGSMELGWSLNSCQGDGVAFYGAVDIDALADGYSAIVVKNAPPLAELQGLMAQVKATDPEATLTVESRSISTHYSHWNSFRVSVDHDSESDAMDGLADLLRAWVAAYLVALSRQFEREGYEEIDHMNSEESFKEACEANDWEFYADGKPAMGDGE